MEHFTNSIADDFVDYKTTHEVCNGIASKPVGEGETSAPKELDVDAILNRTPYRFRHRRSRPLEEAPEFVKRLNAFVEVKAGTDVVFVCQWKAFPNPSIKWYRDDEDITDSEHYTKESQVDGTESLTLTCATKRDEGAYKCKVENQEGVASTTGYLSVTGDIAEKTLSSQQRKTKNEHTISSAPCLRTIKEQKSVEEREADAAAEQEPSPLQTFIDNIRRERTWPTYGTGYENTAEEGENIAGASVNGADADNQDYDRVSFTVKDTHSDQSQNANTLGVPVEEMVRAPSIEDIFGAEGDLEQEDQVENFYPNPYKETTQSETLPKLDISEENYDTMEEDMCPTPTNTLDEPDFDTSTPPQTPVIEDNTTYITQSETELMELKEIPLAMTRVFADQLDLPLIYYFLFTTICAAIAVGTEMPVPYFVMYVALLSLISFRFLLRHNV